jgi:multimeric flavodoxin WrbA/nitrite reductase/ring-hydroxylating ferredoxin subunit
MARSTHRKKRPHERWHDVGDAKQLAHTALQQIQVHGTRMALSCVDGVFGAIHGTCNHAGGPLGQGTLEGDYVVCPWHQWRFHRSEGHGERGFEQDVVPAYGVRVRGGRVQVSVTPRVKRQRTQHTPHPLAREPQREAGPVRVVGISTTAMNAAYPRFSTSDELLEVALARARELGCGTQRIRLRELSFRHCEGYYSKSARACTWPCSITQMDPDDQLDRVYEALVHWADVFVIATPIRWGGPSSLYFKMIERMNCIQNQLTIAGRTLLKDKVLTAIITGGQDNIQSVAGQLLGFFTELGCHIPQYAYIAHSRGWSAEDMERNVAVVQRSEELRAAAGALVERGVELAQRLLATEAQAPSRGGRKGQLLRSAEAALAERAAGILAEEGSRAR